MKWNKYISEQPKVTCRLRQPALSGGQAVFGSWGSRSALQLALPPSLGTLKIRCKSHSNTHLQFWNVMHFKSYTVKTMRAAV